MNVRTSLSVEEATDRKSIAIIYAALLKKYNMDYSQDDHKELMRKAIDLFNQTGR